MPNQMIVWGKIDGDVNVKTVGQDSKTVAEFSINDGSTWVRCAAWEKIANDVPASGTFVIAAGKQRTRSYEKDGQKRYITEMVVSSIEAIGPEAAPDEDLF